MLWAAEASTRLSHRGTGSRVQVLEGYMNCSSDFAYKADSDWLRLYSDIDVCTHRWED